jgi:hypothetical protein
MSGIGEDFIGTGRLIIDYAIENYVETGVERGVALDWVHNFSMNPSLPHAGGEALIGSYYACDLNLTNAALATQNFPYAKIYHLDSISFLSTILPDVAGPTLFWLDAHFPGNYGDPQNISNWFPALNEMRVIKALKHRFEDDIILVDDVGGFVGGSTFDIAGERFSLNVDQLIEVFADTHNCEVLPFNTSVLRCVPK